MNLASIQRITELTPIEGADKIERASVLGWYVVVKKGDFKVGDLCCYVQIDTVCPQTEYFEFLRERKFRVKTIKLRKQLSQGLIVPLNELPFKAKWEEGQDVTDLLEIKKYEKPDNNPIEKYEKPRVPKTFWRKMVYLFKYNFLYKYFPQLRRKLRSPFPTNLVSITDEERIQNCPKILERYKGEEYIASYKLDGSSITIIHNKAFGKSKFRICSRRFELHDKKNDWYKVFEETGFKKYILELVAYFKTNDIIVQGEAIGKFNGNYHKLEKNEIRLFNIYVNGKRLKPKPFFQTVQSLNIPHCPMFEMSIMNFTLEEILKSAQIKDVLNANTEAEGLVYRMVEDGQSFKVINNAYLLKHEQ
jgi:hypothetical protein